jgi:hypothetical protein
MKGDALYPSLTPRGGSETGAFRVQRLTNFHVILILGTRRKTALR